MMGVYEIVNLYDGKATAYIGSSNNIENRWMNHRCSLKGGRHRNAHLQAAWKKYGSEAFEFSILEETSEDMLEVVEQKYLDRYFGWGHCYNMMRIAGVSLRGHALSEEHRRRIGEAGKGRVWSEESRRKLSETAKKRPPPTEECRRKIAESVRGFKHSKATKRKMSERMKGNQFTKGHTLSEEHKRKIGDASRGRKHSELAKSKISNATSKTYPSFIHSETNEIIPAGRNLLKLCHERGLWRSSMRLVKLGRQRSHKGWMLLEKEGL